MNHPKIIKVTDLIDEGDTVAFVMKYLEGQTLKEYLDEKGKLNHEEIKNLFVQMLRLGSCLHQPLCMIHRMSCPKIGLYKKCFFLHKLFL